MYLLPLPLLGLELIQYFDAEVDGLVGHYKVVLGIGCFVKYLCAGGIIVEQGGGNGSMQGKVRR